MPYVERWTPGAPVNEDGSHAGSWVEYVPDSIDSQLTDQYTGVAVDPREAAHRLLIGAGMQPGSYNNGAGVGTKAIDALYASDPRFAQFFPDRNAIYNEVQGLMGRQAGIDAAASNQFDFGKTLLGGAAAGIGALSGGFGLGSLMDSMGGDWMQQFKDYFNPAQVSVSEGGMPTQVAGWSTEMDPNGIWSGNYTGPAETTISEMAGGSPNLGSVAAHSWYPGSLESGTGGWSMPNIGLNEILRMAGPIASLAGGAMGAGAARSAAGTQSQAGRDAIAAQMAMYGQTRADLEPYRLAGNQALGQLQGLTNGPNSPLLKPFGMDDFYKSPAYEFNLSEGMRALNHGAAARQQYYAPATLKSLGDFAQGRASNEFQNAFSNYQTNMGNVWNRLSSLSGMGQNAAANMGSLGANVASNVGNNITGIGNANAAGQVGSANALSGGMSNAYNAYLMDQILSKNQKSGYA